VVVFLLSFQYKQALNFRFSFPPEATDPDQYLNLGSNQIILSMEPKTNPTIAIDQGSTLQNSITAKNFSDKFSASKFRQMLTQNNRKTFIQVLWMTLFHFQAK
jgi:hypothetical protein